MIGNATDGNPSTYWETEEYANLQRASRASGIVLDAGRAVLPKAIVVNASGSELTRANPDGLAPRRRPPTSLRRRSTVDGRTSFKILRGVPARYFMLWITQLDRPRRSSTR